MKLKFSDRKQDAGLTKKIPGYVGMEKIQNMKERNKRFQTRDRRKEIGDKRKQTSSQEKFVGSERQDLTVRK